MTNKQTNNPHNYQKLNLKNKNKNKNKLSKLELEQNHRNGNTRRVISGEGEKGEWGKMYRE